MKGMDDDNQWYDYNFIDHDGHDDGQQRPVSIWLLELHVAWLAVY